jgi:hypothetical protein
MTRWRKYEYVVRSDKSKANATRNALKINQLLMKVKQTRHEMYLEVTLRRIRTNIGAAEEQ